jgi:hypothetical protein
MQTTSEPLEVSARLHDEGCALITAQNATAAATRGRQTGGGSGNALFGRKIPHDALIRVGQTNDLDLAVGEPLLSIPMES